MANFLVIGLLACGNIVCRNQMGKQITTFIYYNVIEKV